MKKNTFRVLNRREFLRLTSATSLALLSARLPVMAGPFETADFDKLVPADKKLDPDWVKSLFARGTPSVYRGGDTAKIGMPVGGICAGQLYLGGDGELWHWDIFNHTAGTGDSHYAHPVTPESPLEQGFAIKIGEQIHPLNRSGFAEVSFRGEYPIGTVEYKDAELPVAVKLEAFSPFIPLLADDSGLPATILQYTVRNTSAAPLEATLTGRLENAVCLYHRSEAGTRRNQIVKGAGFTCLLCSAEKLSAAPAPSSPDTLFEDWNKETYDGWTVEGNAFGKGPVKRSAIPSYQGDVGGDTERVVNTHATGPGSDVPSRDAGTGKLTSRSFTIERNFINFWIGGGKDESKVGLRLVIDDKVALRAAGLDNNQMSQRSFDTRSLKGKHARLEIVDQGTGGWGNVGVGKITFGDRPVSAGPLEELDDFGTMGLALMGAPAETIRGEGSASLSEKLVGELGRKLNLAPGEAATVSFIVSWHFPNFAIPGGWGKVGRYYAAKFSSAQAVTEYIAANFERLCAQTHLWRDTWYDSTLPWWFLDRTFLNTSILATGTCYRFQDGRFWAWEGVGCCHGTCTHVWHYAHAMGRIFPELERDVRERVDLRLSMNPETGVMGFRGEFDRGLAVDGQAGTLLRIYREHQMSKDSEFLKRNWPRIRKAYEPLLKLDGNDDGVLEGAQMNTLDTPWYGKIAWLSGLYLAAMRAGEQMALDMGETAFAERCRKIVEQGTPNLVEQLFNGEYFMNRVDEKRLDCINAGTGCEIDQVFGQSWAFQVGLKRVFPEKETQSALRSLWKYNFSPDVGPYRAVYKPGRWYAMAGEAGLLMCTFPRNDWNYDKARGNGNPGFAGYFNECMNGFEYQVAGHMVWEGLLLEGLAITRSLHDRYEAVRRNPWNEVECGDHYARSMASYGVFTAVCGFKYHGPKGSIGFAPRLTPENFKAAFTSAEGWGSYSQQSETAGFKSQIALKWGSLRLRTIQLTVNDKFAPAQVTVKSGGQAFAASFAVKGTRVTVTLDGDAVVKAGQVLEISLA